MKNLKSILAICAVAVMLTSCEKGETGSPGPQGPQGIQGNANVMEKEYTISSMSSGSNYKYKTLNPTIITTDIVNNGAVLGYIYTGLGWAAVPYPIPLGGNVTRDFRGYHKVSHYELRVTNSDGTMPSVSLPFTLRIVAIAGSRLAANPNVNLNNYEEVKKAFNLPD